MRRREFIMLLGGAAAWPLAVRAQQGDRMRRIGVPMTLAADDPEGQARLTAFAQGLQELGWSVGRNVRIDYRWAAGQVDRYRSYAAELLALSPDVVLAVGSAAMGPLQATRSVPVVFVQVADPVGAGFVASLARPGGNLTGFSNISTELTPKLLELLSELVPQAKAIALLVNPNNRAAESVIRSAQEAARAKGVQLQVLKASTETEIDVAFASLVQLYPGAPVVIGDALFITRQTQVVALASRHAVPAIYGWRESVVAGGLISYGPSNTAASRQVGIYAGRILKGEKPADLPVQQPATFELVINLETAKALGLTVPPSILARADEVIE